MELKTVKAGEWKPAALGGTAGVHRDILEGRDCEIGWEDVFTGKSEPSVVNGQDNGGNQRQWTAWTVTDNSYRQRAPPSARLPHRDGGEAEDELVEALVKEACG